MLHFSNDEEQIGEELLQKACDIFNKSGSVVTTLSLSLH
jgi:hypothetical protein